MSPFTFFLFLCLWAAFPFTTPVLVSAVARGTVMGVSIPANLCAGIPSEVSVQVSMRTCQLPFLLSLLFVFTFQCVRSVSSLVRLFSFLWNHYMRFSWVHRGSLPQMKKGVSDPWGQSLLRKAWLQDFFARSSVPFHLTTCQGTLSDLQLLKHDNSFHLCHLETFLHQFVFAKMKMSTTLWRK